MSADILRSAAALMREEHPINDLGGEFWDAVAEWLEEEAREVEQEDRLAEERNQSAATAADYIAHYRAASEQQHRRALAVALAYLGEEA